MYNFAISRAEQFAAKKFQTLWWRGGKMQIPFCFFQRVQHLWLQSEVLRRLGRDGDLLGKPVSGVDGVVGVDRVQRYLRGRAEEQGT